MSCFSCSRRSRTLVDCQNGERLGRSSGPLETKLLLPDFLRPAPPKKVQSWWWFSVERGSTIAPYRFASAVNKPLPVPRRPEAAGDPLCVCVCVWFISASLFEVLCV